MINPDRITNFHRSLPDLEEFFVFCTTVPGKVAKVQAQRLEIVKKELGVTAEWRPLLQDPTPIRKALEVSRMGQYNRITRALVEFGRSTLDLTSVSRDDLAKIYGVGLKTASFFLLHSRPGWKGACLDRHILSWMRERGCKNIPLETPPSYRGYLEVEKKFLRLTRGQDLAQVDLGIWVTKRK